MNDSLALSADQAAPLRFGMLLYPEFTLLDLAGPQTLLGLYGKTHLLWKNLEPVWSDSGVSMNPTTVFADCPAQLDVLFVPGGIGTNAAMQDAEIIDFLAEAGTRARYITSVCTGSLLLGMAGLLDGYRAATHWAFYDGLEATGAIPVRERVVTDRDRVTGGGVTAGIDFGLTLLAQLRDAETAQAGQLMMEYDPKPPFDAGSPARAGMHITDLVLASGLTAMGLESVEIAKAKRLQPA